MNKKYIRKIYNYFLDKDKWETLKTKFKTQLKKFQKFYKKRFFIKYKYPHKKSNSKCKSYVSLKRYNFKERLWYKGKKNCLLFYHFSCVYSILIILNDNFIENYYNIECEFNKIFQEKNTII